MSDNIARILALAAIGAGGGGGGGALTPIVVDVLPSVGEEGKLYLVPRQVTETHNVFDEYIYTNGDWEKIGTADINLSNYYTKSEVNALIPDELADLSDDSTHRLVTDTEKSTWGAKYDKPSGGIPKTDLTSAVQTSLGKADSALQSFTEIDPVFGASAAAGITSSDITSWNNKLSSETDPIFSASAASWITNADITNWNNKQDAITTMNIVADYDENSEKYVIAANDVNRILDKRASGDKFDLFVDLKHDSSFYTISVAHFIECVASGDSYLFIILQSLYDANAGSGDEMLRGDLVRNYDCVLERYGYEFIENREDTVTLGGGGYPSTKAVYNFGVNNFLSKTNTTSYTPTANYHPATKKYVDDKANDYLAKNNTTSYTPSGNYNPATKKYVDDSINNIDKYVEAIQIPYSVFQITADMNRSQIIEHLGGQANVNKLFATFEEGNPIFCSGIISGYFDYDYLQVPITIRYADMSGYYMLSFSAVVDDKYNELVLGSDDTFDESWYVIRKNAGLLGLQWNSMPVPSFDWADSGIIVQYVGATNQNYTKGYFYKCVEHGDGPYTYSWDNINVQPSGGSSEYEFFVGTESEWNELTEEEKINILFAAVEDEAFELTAEEEAELLTALGEGSGIEVDMTVDEALEVALEIAGESE